jgi:hypothetical protein
MMFGRPFLFTADFLEHLPVSDNPPRALPYRRRPPHAVLLTTEDGARLADRRRACESQAPTYKNLPLMVASDRSERPAWCVSFRNCAGKGASQRLE